MVAEVGRERLDLTQVHRFDNAAVQDEGTWYWDILSLYQGMLAGLRAAVRDGPVDAVGIDSWAVDYGLLDAGGNLLGNPVSHRDPRTKGAIERVRATVPDRELFARTGLQQLPLNTLYQLVAERDGARLADAKTLLLLPDLLAYWLTGEKGAELTNASTTQLLEVNTGAWATDLLDRLGLPARILPPVRRPGQVIGRVREEVARELGLPAGTGLPVIAVASHDTASAVVGTPMAAGERAAYISSGTWSLVGVELTEPVLTEEARAANFTNETGLDGTIRFLRNVMGLWLLSQTLDAWAEQGQPVELAGALAAAESAEPFVSLVDVDDARFTEPGDMPARLEAFCREAGQPVPAGTGAVVRCILESLAMAYRRTVREASLLSGRPVEMLHVVGGGVLNELLCQLTADACGIPVMAGPVEATALGNVLVQARALGADLPDLAAMRELLRRTHPQRRHDPRGEEADWQAAEKRLPPRRDIAAGP